MLKGISPIKQEAIGSGELNTNIASVTSDVPPHPGFVPSDDCLSEAVPSPSTRKSAADLTVKSETPIGHDLKVFDENPNQNSVTNLKEEIVTVEGQDMRVSDVESEESSDSNEVASIAEDHLEGSSVGEGNLLDFTSVSAFGNAEFDGTVIPDFERDGVPSGM
ncbi:hypothetical protein U1Q18_022569 [Sarracenia purpurea var. burkii]